VAKSVPSGPQELSVAWLRRTLAEAGDPRAEAIASVRSERIGVGYGLDGTLARLTLADAAGREWTLVAKWCGKESGAHEARVYRELGDRLGNGLARLVAAEVGADRALLLLEDIAPAKQGDALVGASPSEAQQVFEVMARFHSACWEGRGHPHPVWLPRWGRSVAKQSDLTRTLLPRFVRRWGPVLPHDVVAAAERLPEALLEAHDRLERAPATLVHGDLHLDNALFRPDGSPVVIDWTTAARGPAAIDVMHVLIEGMTIEARRRLEPSLLARYLDALSGCGIRYEAADLRAHLDDALTVLFAGAVRYREPSADSPQRLGPIVENLVRNVAAAVEDRLSAA
jgi:hypothetical protein